MRTRVAGPQREEQNMSSWLRRFLVGMMILPVLTVPVMAQGPYVGYQWHTFFGGDPNEAATLPATAVDASGNLYLTGTTQFPWDEYGNPGGATNQLAHEAYLTKVSPTGQLLWSKFYVGFDAYGRSWIQGELRPVAITLDSSGNIYIAGAGKIENEGTNFS